MRTDAYRPDLQTSLCWFLILLLLSVESSSECLQMPADAYRPDLQAVLRFKASFNKLKARLDLPVGPAPVVHTLPISQKDTIVPRAKRLEDGVAPVGWALCAPQSVPPREGACTKDPK